MARNYARIVTSIWSNEDFRKLPEPAQRLYLLLVTQPDISAAGVLALRLRRWTEMSCTSATDALIKALKALEGGRFIVVDWDKEEVLVRSFVRHDGGHSNPKRRPSIIRAAAEVASRSIKDSLAKEFARCGIEVRPDSPARASRTDRDSHADRHSDSHSEASGTVVGLPLAPSASPQVEGLSDTQAAEEGVVVGYLSSSETTTHNPQPTAPNGAAAVAATAPATPPTTDIKIAQELAAAYVELVPMSNFPAVLGVVRKALRSRYPPLRISQALQRLAEEGRSVTVETLRIEMEGKPSRLRAVPDPAVTGQRICEY